MWAVAWPIAALPAFHEAVRRPSYRTSLLASPAWGRRPEQRAARHMAHSAWRTALIRRQVVNNVSVAGICNGRRLPHRQARSTPM